MAGHSKWANIKFRKGAQDAKRGKIFTKLIREITTAARLGGAEESNNPRLRDAITKALKSNMKRDTIDNAIKRGTGNADDAQMLEMTYEGYGPGGVAILVKCLSDNKNRTVSEVRHAFTKHGGNLGADGSVAYLFNHLGEIFITEPNKKDLAIELAINEGADDIQEHDDALEIITPVEEYHKMIGILNANNINIEHSELTMRPVTQVKLDPDNAETVTKLIDALEDLDDVQTVYTNVELNNE
jgi:YebC/PmpR family DNA-binding regulatory protein